ncbi:MAG: hypothetical protein BWY47_01853 [Bacteroidetes bacterium ADurb.Bin302]|nr:MAG: hypothetical protein BWY47_01853 [Bacteroidetes bacterium ADurb.Bin302]
MKTTSENLPEGKQGINGVGQNQNPLYIISIKI